MRKTGLNCLKNSINVLRSAARLGFAKHADRIVVVKDGCIVEDGTHDDLLSCEGEIYKEMFESRLEWYK